MHQAKNIQLSVCSDGNRVVVIKATKRNPNVMRIRSMPADEFNLEQTLAVMDVTLSETNIILLPSNSEVRAELANKVIVPHIVRSLRQAPSYFQAAFLQHLRLPSVVDERAVFRSAHPLTPSMQRMFDRLGEHGYALVAGQDVLGSSRAVGRVAAAAYLAYTRWPRKRPARDALSRELIAWNLISQAFFALENFGAFFAALKATRGGNYSAFAGAYLSFGRGESKLQGASIMQTLDELSGQGSHKIVADTFQIPLGPRTITACGLEGCGIEERLLVRAGQYTAAFLVREFRRLASLMIQKEAGTGRPLRTAAAQAYGAFRHGFAISIPMLIPRSVATSVETSLFASDDDFEQHITAANTLGEFAYMNEQGNIDYISPPLKPAEIRPYVRIVWRCGMRIREFAKYAESLYGSVDGRFPYLINSSQILGPERRLLLQQRLDQLEGLGA